MLVTSLVIVVLDNTVLNVALKTIQEDLGATQSELVWSINAYALVFAALLFTWGVLGDRYGRKKTLMIGMASFGLFSALTAWAQSPEQLIAARALMGVGAASVLPLSLAIITVIFPPQERGKAIGIWAAAAGGSIALGPIVAGMLLEHFWWGSVFLINVPVVVIGLVGTAWVVPETKNPVRRKLDPVGLVLSVIGLLMLVYGIQEAGWGLWATYAWIAGGVAVLAAFLWYESRIDHPSLDVTLFRIRSFSTPLGVASLSFAALSGVILFLTFYMQIVRGWSPLVAGCLFLPFAAGQLLGAPASAAVVRRIGARTVIAGGLAFAALGSVGIALYGRDTPIWFMIVAALLFGYGMGNVMAPATTRMTLATPPQRSGPASAVQQTVRQVGGVLGVAIISSVGASIYAHAFSPALSASALPPAAQTAASDSLGATVGVVDAATASGQLPAGVAASLLDDANDAFLQVLHVSGWVAAVTLLVAALAILVWLPKQAEAVPWAGGHGQPGRAPEPEHAADAVHLVDEDSDHLAHVEEAPLERNAPAESIRQER
ncbi:MAG: MFS transporter [Actinomycetota bacterium]|nr:MAG: MFS transporter [Actinomycetota bacterium]